MVELKGGPGASGESTKTLAEIERDVAMRQRMAASRAHGKTIEQLEADVKGETKAPVVGTVFTPKGDVKVPFIPFVKQKPGKSTHKMHLPKPPAKKQALAPEPKPIPHLHAPKLPALHLPKLPELPKHPEKPAKPPKPPKPPKAAKPPKSKPVQIEIPKPSLPELDVRVSKLGKPVLAVAIVVVLLVIGLVAKLTLGDGKNPLLKPGEASAALIPIYGEPTINNLRVYVRTATAPNDTSVKSVVYVLTDGQGTKLYEGAASNQLELLTPVGNDKLLFIDSSQNNYVLLSKDGFRTLVVPDSMRVSSAREDSPVGMASFGQDTVLYQHCTSAGTCDLRTYNVSTTQETVSPAPPMVKDYGGKFKGLSPDRQTAYFFGIAPKDQKTFEGNALKLPKSTSQNDKAAQQLYTLLITRSVLALDLATQTVSQIYPVSTEYSYYQQFWLSPNGQHLVYSNGGEAGNLHYVNVPTNEIADIKLPQATYSTEPWSAETTTIDPEFSPDGDKMSFVTYDTKYGNTLESLGLLDLKAKSAVELARQPNDGTDTTGYYTNMRWFETVFDIRSGRDAYRYGPDALAQKLPDSNGLIIGSADGTSR